MSCIAELSKYTSEAPAKGVTFDIVAEVTFPYTNSLNSFTVKDTSGSISLSDERTDRRKTPVAAGDIVRVQGITDDTIYGVIYPGCRQLAKLSHKMPHPLPPSRHWIS